MQDLLNAWIKSLGAKTMRLVGVDSVDSSRSTSEQVTGVAEVSPAFKIEATVRLNECDHVVRVIVGPTWHVRIARPAIVLFVFVDMPDRQAALSAGQLTIEANWLAIFDQQILTLRKAILYPVNARILLNKLDPVVAGLGQIFWLEPFQLIEQHSFCKFGHSVSGF